MKPQDDVQHRFLYELGEGSYGVVYLAEDRINGGRLAIKIPKPNDHVDLSVLERSLWEEISHLTQLSPYDNPHPHIVQPKGVKRFRSEDGIDLLGIITEFVPGRVHPETGRVKGCDLETHLVGSPRRPDSLDRVKLVRAVAQVCDALAHAHRKNVFHRDIKPNNILVRLPDETVKVADWGVAKNIEMDGLWEGSIVGTRPYMPPEVLARMDLYRPPDAREPQKIDHRADIFSLGISVFKIVAGRHPFKNPNDIGNPVQRAAQEEVLALAIGAPLAAVVMRALEHEADRRYADANEFAAALNQGLAQQSPVGASPGPATLDERLEQASAIVRAGDRDGSAESRYQAIIADFPGDPRPYLDFARFCASFRTHDDTARILSTGIERAPASADLRFQRGRIYRAVGRTTEAAADLETALHLGLDADRAVQAERLLARLREPSTVAKG